MQLCTPVCPRAVLRPWRSCTFLWYICSASKGGWPSSNMCGKADATGHVCPLLQFSSCYRCRLCHCLLFPLRKSLVFILHFLLGSHFCCAFYHCLLLYAVVATCSHWVRFLLKCDYIWPEGNYDRSTLKIVNLNLDCKAAYFKLIN